ncbi:SdrD B-like domain-containing protein [Lewinella sp. W8]|uniref:SdrD B-like domain-containing protein n=1 Tax=Lewinella sp. W8 TaxID=2528208 RepID=UPI001564C51F|nr:SdrD B-like domain-containing protein [Lewinella sp. W8]
MKKSLPLATPPGKLLALLFLFLPMAVFGQLSISVTGQDISCFGLANGVAQVTVSDATPPVSFSWSNGGDTPVIDNLTAGTYEVTVTDGAGGSASGSVTLFEPERVTATITDAEGCEGPFMIAAEPMGGVTPYRYNWSTGAETRAVVVPAGDYCVTVVDANLCGYVACTTIVEDPPVITLVDVDAQCADSNDGSLTATTTGGTPPFTFAWSNGGSGPMISGLAPGTYGVTLTDARGCTATATGTVGAPPALTGSIFGDETVCPGEADAFLRIAPSGGTPPYSYNWEPGAFTGQGIGPLPAGTYSVTVTDANECTLVDTYVITESPEVEIEIVGDLLLCGSDATGSLTARPLSGPTSQYTYAWSTGAVGPTVSGLGAGTYTVTATDVNGCTAEASATIRTIEISVSLSSTPTSCADENDGTATATVTGGDAPITYAWSNGGTTATITGLAPGTYTVTVTEANDCKATGSVVVGSPDELVLAVDPENVDCPGDATGSIDLTVTGGTAPFTYLWSNGATTEDISGLMAGTYSNTTTDANGCTETITVQINQPANLMITDNVVDVDCNGAATGRITVLASGGTPVYTYAWNTGATTRTITDLTAGTYVVTVTDANDCEIVASFTVNEPTAIMVSGTVTDNDCFGEDEGAIDLTVAGGTGGYAFQWSNGATTEDITGLTAGTYDVTVTDVNDCEATASFTVEEADEIDLSVVPTNVLCFGGNDGSIDLTVMGGLAPYTYLWTTGATTEDLSGLTAGTYTVVVTDAGACQASISVSIQQPSALEASAALTNVACPGDATGSINLTVSGGTPAYTFAWSNGATTEDIGNLMAGTYGVTITDANNCTLEQSYTLTANDEIMISGVVTDADCNGEASGSIDLTVSGGSGTFAFLWSNGATTEDLTDVAAGTYTVTVTDGNECQSVASFTVGEPDEILLTATTPTITCGGTESGMITLTVVGGTEPYTYAWSNGTSGEILENVPAGSYSVTVTDANGCMATTSSLLLTELPELVCSVVVDQESTAGDNGALSVMASGGTQPYTYSWSNGETTESITDLAPGTYSVTVTDANGCTTSCTGTLTAFAGIGDFVWQDFNVNGQQDPGEPGIADYPVYLKNAAGEIIDSTRTDENGNYAFLGLVPGTYSILFIEPPGGIRTLANSGDDATDSDGDPDMDGMTQTYTLEPGEYNMTVDAGFFAEPGAAIVDPCNCLNNNTNDIDGQFSEVLEITADPGQTWTILSNQNMYLLESEDPPAAPIPVPVGTVLEEVSPGVYRIEFKLVDEFVYSSTLTNGVFTLTISNQCFYPTISFEDNLPESVCRFEPPFQLFAIASIPGTIVYTVNGEEVDELDPSMLPQGEVVITASLIPDDPEECITFTERQVLITEDCDAKIGDFVWNDLDNDGIQDPGEPGIPNVTVIVTSEDGTYMDQTMTDETGMYMFAVPPGTYKVTFIAPDGFDPSPDNNGSDDELDSDMDPVTFMTPFYTVGPDEMDFSIDAGFFNPCIENVNDPGVIGFSQEICGPGNTPDPFIEVSPATGGVGEIEYLWMFNEEDPSQDISFWTPIPNTNSPNYAPGPVSRTTYFVRCVRRNNCPYIEGNVLTVDVGDDAVAEISGPNVLCVGESATFTAEGVEQGAVINWVFTGLSAVETSSAASVTTSWATFGSFSITLTVTANGCTSTQTRQITIINNPSACGDDLVAGGTINSLQAREVTIDWTVPYDGSDYDFTVERSLNGEDFTDLVSVNTPAFISANGNTARFELDDVSPLAGRTFYRVRLNDAEYGDLWSNVVALQLAPPTTAIGRVFPNPIQGSMMHVEMTEEASEELPMSVQLYDVRGNVVGPRTFLRPGRGVVNLNIGQQAAGVYILRLTAGDRSETHRVIID